MRQRLHLITLGVENMPRSLEFYENGLGWKRSEKSLDNLILFDLDGLVLALHPRHELELDTTLTFKESPFAGMSISYNARSKVEVDEVMEQVSRAGGTLVKPAQNVYWGGYSGYFKDLDGYLFEVAYNPFWELDANHHLRL